MDSVRNSALDWLTNNGRVKMNPLTDEQEQVSIIIIFLLMTLKLFNLFKDFKNAESCIFCGKGNFLSDDAVLREMKKDDEKDNHHLDYLKPHLELINFNLDKIPSLKEVKKCRREQLVGGLHPDKQKDDEPESVKQQKLAECQQFIKASSVIIEYMKNNGLAYTDEMEEEVEESVEDILKKLDISIEEFEKYKKSKSSAKVRDHCHFTGNFRGAAHSKCNIKARVDIENAKFPVFLHNFAGYDSHIILQAYAGEKIEIIEPDNELSESDPDLIEITARTKERKLKVLAKSFEKFISLQVDKHIIFKDSLSFLPSSLDSLVQNLRQEAGDDEESITKMKNLFKNTYNFFKRKYPLLNENLFFKYLTRKGVYPYQYMDSFEKFKETSLPSKDAYKSDLTGEDISNDEYQFAKDMWKDFGLETLGELHDLYLSTDVMLLADVFER